MKTKVRKGKNSIVFGVEYVDEKGTTFTENVENTSPSIQKCGFMLQLRKDCFKEDK